ncbi:hypothetical protein D3C71_2201910 [compost metagenome]
MQQKETPSYRPGVWAPSNVYCAQKKRDVYDIALGDSTFSTNGMVNLLADSFYRICSLFTQSS